MDKGNISTAQKKRFATYNTNIKLPYPDPLRLQSTQTTIGGQYKKIQDQVNTSKIVDSGSLAVVGNKLNKTREITIVSPIQAAVNKALKEPAGMRFLETEAKAAINRQLPMRTFAGAFGANFSEFTYSSLLTGLKLGGEDEQMSGMHAFPTSLRFSYDFWNNSSVNIGGHIIIAQMKGKEQYVTPNNNTNMFLQIWQPLPEATGPDNKAWLRTLGCNEDKNYTVLHDSPFYVRGKQCYSGNINVTGMARITVVADATTNPIEYDGDIKFILLLSGTINNTAQLYTSWMLEYQAQ